MNLKEALKHARDFNNFFKAFKNIEEIIEAGAHLDQNIKDLEDTKDRISSDIEALKVHKADAEQVLSETKEATKQAKADHASEMRLASEQAKAEKDKLIEEIDAIKKAKMSALADHDKEMARITSEKEKLESNLAKIQGKLDAIKSKLNG